MRRRKSVTGKRRRCGRRCRALLGLAATSAMGGWARGSAVTNGSADIGNGNGGDVAYVADAGDSSAGSFTLTGQSWSNGTMSVANGFESNGQILIQASATYNVSGGLFLTQGDNAESSVTVDSSALNTGSLEYLPDSDTFAINGVIGNVIHGSASVTIRNNSSWTNIGGIGVGFLGNANLDVQNNSSVITSLLLVGNEGVGTMTVNNSAITVFPDFQIGADSAGSSVSLAQSSTLTAGTLSMSESAGSAESLLDIGNGSQVSISGGANVGRYGSATLNVHDNSSFTSGNLFLAQQPGVTAALNVTNTSTAGFVQLNVGLGGTATLTVSGQSNITSTGAFIGVNEGAGGTVNIGQASEDADEASDGGWVNSGSLSVGNAGTGYLNVNTPASSVVTDTLILGGMPGGAGTMAVNGGYLTVSTIAYVGEDGTGTLNLNSGAVVNVFDMAVGSDVTAADEANGTVNVDGSDTFLTASDSILVGQGATDGKIFVDSGGVLTSPETNIGEDAASTGTLRFTNGSFGAIGNTYVGLNGNGTLEIDQSAVMATAMYVGYGETATGLVTVSGSNGYLTVAGDLYVGQYSESGTLQMSGGANLQAADIYVGENTGGTGTFNISGAADDNNNPLGLAHADGTLSVGGSGTGIMQMNDGAQVVAGYTVVGRDADGIGTLSIIGDSDGGPQPQLFTGDTEVGYQGTGTVAMSVGGMLSASSLTVGSMAGAVGIMSADGANTSVNISGCAVIGAGGNGMLTVSGGAAMNNGDALVAQSVGSVSSVTVTGEDSLWSSGGSLYIGGSATTAGGSGNVTVDSGATVAVAGTLEIWNTGELDVNGGTVTTGDVEVNGGTLAIFIGGRVHVTGAMTVSNSGRVNIGGASTSVGSLSISPNSAVNLNSALFVNYGVAANDPVVTIVSYLQSGYKGGAWTGTSGIISTMAAGSLSPILSVGYADGNVDAGTPATANQLVILLTLAGDAYLNGTVNFNDLDVVGQHLNTTGNDWARGNFTYDPNGAVNFNDLDIIGRNLNKTINASGIGLGGTTVPLGAVANVQDTTAMPEPGTLAIAAAGAGGMLRRRRRGGREMRVKSTV